MAERFKFALIGTGVGLLASLIAWGFIGMFLLDGGWTYFLRTVACLVSAGALVGLLAPRKAADYFTQLIVGLLENTNV